MNSFPEGVDGIAFIIEIDPETIAQCKDCGKEQTPDPKHTTDKIRFYTNKPCEYCGGEVLTGENPK